MRATPTLTAPAAPPPGTACRLEVPGRDSVTAPVRGRLPGSAAPPPDCTTLGARPLDALLTVALPLARPGLLSAAVLGFAHTLGEFGVVLMIGGNIPGETRVASIAIYEHVESLDYAAAHGLSLVLLVLSFLLLLLVFRARRGDRVLSL